MCVEIGVSVEVRKSERDMERFLRKGDSRTQGEREIMPQEVIVEWRNRGQSRGGEN